MNPFFYIGIFFISAFNYAQTKVDVSVDTNKVLVGDVIQMDVLVESDTQVLWPDIPALITPVEVQSFSEIDSVLTSKKHSYHQNFSIQHFDTGEFVLPQIPFVSSNGDTFYSDSVDISFVPVLLDTTNAFFDIKPPEEVPFNFSEAKPFIFVSLIILLSIILAYYLIQKFRNRNLVFQEEVIDLTPCDILALEALKELELLGLCESGEVKSHYVQLTEILRVFFDREYQLDTIESTTEEIVELLKSKNIDKSLRNDIRSLLEEADLVKFAKRNPDNFINDQFMKTSYRIVQDCHKMNGGEEDV